MQIFISYTRNKDNSGVVSRFSAQFSDELNLILPQSTVFFDKQNIHEGDHFPELLTTELKKSEALIVLLSPAWLASTWCRWEFEIFTDKMANAEKMRKVIPILWVETPKVSEESPDPIAAFFSTVHHADWRERRFHSWRKVTNAREISALATQVKDLSGPSRHVITLDIASNNIASTRLTDGVEQILILLAENIDDGLHEDDISSETGISRLRVVAHLDDLQHIKKFVRHLLRTTPGMSRWILNHAGMQYLIRHNLVP